MILGTRTQLTLDIDWAGKQHQWQSSTHKNYIRSSLCILLIQHKSPRQTAFCITSTRTGHNGQLCFLTFEGKKKYFGVMRLSTKDDKAPSMTGGHHEQEKNDWRHKFSLRHGSPMIVFSIILQNECILCLIFRMHQSDIRMHSMSTASYKATM